MVGFRSFSIFVAVIGFVVISGCKSEQKVDAENKKAATLPNPAAQFCVEHGGEYILATGECKLANSESVDAWEYFRSQAKN